MTTHPLTKAFQALRKLDYLAERNFSCCRSCAIEEIPDEKACLYVYTTEQDERDLKKFGGCYLGWSAPEDSAKEIIKELKKVGLKVKHSGSPRDRIYVKL